MSIDKYLETILHFAGGRPYKQEILEARTQFFEQNGPVSEEEDQYEERLNQFLDWYLFERPLSDTGNTPVETFYEKFHRTFGEEDEVVYDGLRKSFRSLFIVKKSDEEGVWIRDLIAKRKYFVDDEVPKGFFRDEIFQVRLIPYHGGYCFGEDFCFHPIAANKIILRRAKKLDRENSDQVEKLLEDLIVSRRNSLRYRHVEVAKFYEQKD